MSLTVSRIFFYPVKSFAGIEVTYHKIDDRGFEYDRRWMLIDENNKFISQRTVPELALILTQLEDDKILLSHRVKKEFSLEFQINEHTDKLVKVQIFDDFTDGYLLDDKINSSLSELLNRNVRMVFMADDIKRFADNKYAKNNELVSYADGFPFLLLGEESLKELNGKLSKPVDINRFRPNIVFNGGHPFIEDDLKEIKINGINFKVVKPCSRCVITTIDQSTAIMDNEPLVKLSEFRRVGNKVMFGQNLLHTSPGIIHIGDKIEIVE